jgi:hypothetical protein
MSDCRAILPPLNTNSACYLLLNFAAMFSWKMQFSVEHGNPQGSHRVLCQVSTRNQVHILWYSRIANLLDNDGSQDELNSRFRMEGFNV